jgi:hypothetical protein
MAHAHAFRVPVWCGATTRPNDDRLYKRASFHPLISIYANLDRCFTTIAFVVSYAVAMRPKIVIVLESPAIWVAS